MDVNEWMSYEDEGTLAYTHLLVHIHQKKKNALKIVIYCPCSPNLGRLEGIFWNHENLTISWCVIIVEMAAIFRTDELLVSIKQ